MDVPTSGIARLNYYVSERRRSLQISRTEMFKRGGPSPSTMNKAVSGARAVSPRTLERLDRALGWAPGSAANTVNGGTPTSRLDMSIAGASTAAAQHAQCLTVIETVRQQLQASERLLAEMVGASDHAC